MKNRHEGLAEMKKDGVTYCNMFWLFMFGNVLGVLLEGTWCRLIFGHWETHVATIWGPFSLIYGVGAVMFYISGEKIRSTGYKGVVARFCSIAIVATVFELACGLLLEYGMGMKAWDYSKSFMNYKGLICLKMTLLWGLAGVIFSFMLVNLFDSSGTLIGVTDIKKTRFQLSMIRCGNLHVRWVKQLLMVFRK